MGTGEKGQADLPDVPELGAAVAAAGGERLAQRVQRDAADLENGLVIWNSLKLSSLEMI